MLNNIHDKQEKADQLLQETPQTRKNEKKMNGSHQDR